LIGRSIALSLRLGARWNGRADERTLKMPIRQLYFYINILGMQGER
jgi:hypothetical protein